ncbi:MAG: helix-turn-helix domain-containing protein [Clostridia bacterium]|nr:helix-turn-helix domain-containing protein [Clostridia bacterium]
MATGKYQKWLTPDGLMLLEGWARDGLTDEQLARKMGISCGTLYAWKNKFPEISKALKKGKEVVDVEVENALLKRALGYEYTEMMVEHSPDGVKRRETVKFIPPDVTAQIFWLKNRKPETWREKQVVEVSEEALDRAREILGGVKSVIQ